jgi:DNA repair exonuclease SbcCD ATPase subunit
MRSKPVPVILSGLACSLVLAGCQSAYYAAWETVGREKRDLLRSNVEKVQDEQQEAAETFQSALDRLRQIVDVEDTDLEELYDRLSNDLERSENRAEAVRDRIRNIDQIAADLFKEWEKEIGQYSSPRLAARSREKLGQTRDRYDSLHQALTRAEASMDPVLTRFRDHVLYLKHNLNAAAVGGLAGEVEEIEQEVAALVRDMERSIAEADTFLAEFEEG